MTQCSLNRIDALIAWWARLRKPATCRDIASLWGCTSQYANSIIASYLREGLVARRDVYRVSEASQLQLVRAYRPTAKIVRRRTECYLEGHQAAF